MKLSICIPTYNRAKHLENCLNSIKIAMANSSLEFEVCISDNSSSDNTKEVTQRELNNLPLKYSRNEENLGIPRNFLKVVSMASGEFAWLVGDDDLLTPDSLKRIDQLLSQNPGIDFFYVNAYMLSTSFLSSFKHPFDTNSLPKEMNKFSSYTKEGPLNFLNLIDPKISFDFLGGMFLSIFKRSLWLDNVNKLDSQAIVDMRTFSHFDNTFPHVKIFANAFSHSKAYFNIEPVLVCLEGAREWAPMSPLIRSVRLVEALKNYRANGLGLWRYIYCRNFALKYLQQDILLMFIHKNASGRQFVSLSKLFLYNIIYPNALLSGIYTVYRKLKNNLFAA